MIYRVPKGKERQIQEILFSKGYVWIGGAVFLDVEMVAIRTRENGRLSYFPPSYPPKSNDTVIDLIDFNEYYETTKRNIPV